MIRHLTGADFRVMPWANGRGTTTELWREDRDGQLFWRLSRARVVEDGAFSLLPGVARNLTVINGPGFDLVGEGLHMRAVPFHPVAFGGELAIRAAGVTAPSDDFNVMTAADAPRPDVQVLTGRHAVTGTAALTAVYFIGAGTVDGKSVASGDMILTDTSCIADSSDPMLVVKLFR
jgi:environmental stress-induced protein Ves